MYLADIQALNDSAGSQRALVAGILEQARLDIDQKWLRKRHKYNLGQAYRAWHFLHSEQGADWIAFAGLHRGYFLKQIRHLWDSMWDDPEQMLVRLRRHEPWCHLDRAAASKIADMATIETRALEKA